MEQLTERQQEVYDVYHDQNCSVSAVCNALNIRRSAVMKHLYFIARKGFYITPDLSSPVAPAGWSSTFKTVQYNKSGVVQTWDRLKPDEIQLEQMWQFLKDRTPTLENIIDAPEQFNKHLCLEWKLMDHHLGMHAWAKEVGEDYNIKIAHDLIVKSAEKIFGPIGSIAKSIIVLGGDNIHADNRNAITEKSKHHLDMDTRYAKTIDCIYEGIVTAIDIGLQKSSEVLVIVLSGNHDYHSALNLARILKAHYRKNNRVEIDTSPSKHKFTRWGNTYFMYTHGDTGTNKRFATFFLNYLLNNNITGVARKLIRRAHDHQQKKDVYSGLTEEDGVIIEHFPTLAPRDAYSYDAAYSNVRATVSELHHDRYGQVGRRELGIMELMED